MTSTAATYCRLCGAACGLVVEITDGQVTSVTGDKDNALSRGFTCPKGRHIADFGSDPERLLRSQKRTASGSFEDIDASVAVEEIHTRLQEIIAEHGPDSVAFYSGTQASYVSLTNPFATTWWRTMGSRKNFSSMTIDQSAKWVAEARLGRWAAGMQRFGESDVWILDGSNPLVSMQGGSFTGVPVHDGLRRLQREKRRGLKMVVVDPRRTELATYADIHLQLIPGTDSALFAGLLNVLFTEGLINQPFCDRWVAGLDDLRAAVAPFTPEVVASICGVPAEDLIEAARIFGRARRGMTTSGTGPDMGPEANLAEHLIQCMNVVCGRFPEAGDELTGAAVLGSAKPLRAEVVPPRRTWESGYQSRFGYGMLQGQLPTPSLADDILTPGPDQIRAMVVNGGNPAASVPDQHKMVKALESLELLVTVDPFMSETAQLAHYVIAPVLHLERPDTTRAYENMFDVSFAQYTPALLPAPEGVIDDWEFFLKLAWAAGNTLQVAGREYPPGSPLPSTDEVLASFSSRARVPLDEVKRHPHGKVFDELPPAVAAPADPDAAGRFDVMPTDVAAELASSLAAAVAPRDGERPFRLVVRRTKSAMNSLGKRLPGLKTNQNPCYVHPDDLARLGIAAGQRVSITTDHGVIEALAAADATMRPGVVSMSHSFGSLPGGSDEPGSYGSNVNLLLSVEHDLQPISAMPQMTAVPVTLAAV
ncbi:MAG: molybdopterin oxidoreductase [Acidimicrobiia bacterium]|nr:molybdopterin oxidoreductase [Acidimicrobiia bacterium]